MPGDLLHRALAAESRARELGAVQIFVETRVLPADVAERILAELQYQTAETVFVQEMAVAFLVQLETGGSILRRSHPSLDFLTQRTLEILIILLRVFVDVDLPCLAAGVPASARLAVEVREECGENGQGHGGCLLSKNKE